MLPPVKRRIRWWLRIVGCLAVLSRSGWGCSSSRCGTCRCFTTRPSSRTLTELKAGSDHLLRQVAALEGVARRPGHWKVRFTAEEINGWLAVDLIENHPHVLPPGISDARVAIHADRIKLACRSKDGLISCVLSLAVRPVRAEPDVAALRLIQARAGAIPIPLGGVVKALSQAARSMHLPLQWRQDGGDPVAVIALPGEYGGRRPRSRQSCSAMAGSNCLAPPIHASSTPTPVRTPQNHHPTTRPQAGPGKKGIGAICRNSPKECRAGQANRCSGGASVVATWLASPQITELRFSSFASPTKGLPATLPHPTVSDAD